MRFALEDEVLDDELGEKYAVVATVS